jgi:hypothetical protein
MLVLATTAVAFGTCNAYAQSGKTLSGRIAGPDYDTNIATHSSTNGYP